MIKELCEKLENNFLFQTSLGSKELFHSNILAWILEQKTPEGDFEVLKSFAADVAGIEINKIINNQKRIVFREQNNLDLIIKWTEDNDQYFIFIENKMKSIPTLEQLKRYDLIINDKTKGVNQNKNAVKKLLLTPFSNKNIFHNNSNANNENEIDWKNVSYFDHIIPFMYKISSYNFQNDDVTFVIKKYISFLEDQHKLLISFCLDSESPLFKNREYDFYASNKMGEIREIRLHDLVLKLAHSKIEYLLRESLKIENIEVNRFETSFTNSTGISSVEIKISEKHSFCIGIQLQGNQFRYYVQTHKGEDIKRNERLSVELFNNQLWFYDIDTNQPLKGNGRRNEYYKNLGLKDGSGSRSFCEYNNGGFVYFYKELNKQGETLLISDIISLFVRSLKQFIKNRTQILDMLEKI